MDENFSVDRKCKMPGREGNTAVTRPANYFAVSFLQVMSFLAVFFASCVYIGTIHSAQTGAEWLV